MKQRKSKLVISIMTVLMMVLTLVPTLAFAEDAAADAGDGAVIATDSESPEEAASEEYDVTPAEPEETAEPEEAAEPAVEESEPVARVMEAAEDTAAVTNNFNGTITVTDSSTSETIANAKLNLADKDSGEIKYSVDLGTAGTFSVDVTPATYMWNVTADGYDASDYVTSGMGTLANPAGGKSKTLNQAVSLTKAIRNTLNGTITVKDSETSETITNAKLNLADSDGVVKYSVDLGETGTFSIDVVPATYKWNVTAEGYNDSDYVTSGMGTLANVAGGKTKTLNQTVTLTEKTYGTAVISGTVTDKATAAALSGVSIQLKQGTENKGAAVTTGVDGSYKIEDVEAGDYTIEATLKGYKVAVTDSFTVADGAVIENKDIALEEEVIVVISGKVVDEEGNPMSGVGTVGLYKEDGTAVDFATGKYTNENGEFTLGTKNYGGVGPGNYYVEANVKGYYVARTNVTVNEDGSYDSVVVTIKEDPIKDATICGTIYVQGETGWEPLSGGSVSVELWKDGQRFQGPMSSSYNDGTYKFKGYSNDSMIKAGTYVVKVTTSASSKYQAATSAPIVIEDSTEEQTVTQDIYLGTKDDTAATIISGTVDVKAYDGAVVTAHLLYDGTEIATTICDEKGNYVFVINKASSAAIFGTDATARYTVKITADGYISTTSEPFDITDGTSYCGGTLTIHKLGIKVSNLPDKTVYGEGELLDITGLQVEAYYDDNEADSKVLNLKDESDDSSEGYTISGYALSPGKNTITVSYTEGDATVSTSFDVTVKTTASAGAGTDEDSDAVADSDSDNSSKTGSTAADADDSAKTGDSMNLLLNIAIIIMTAIVASGALFMRRRSNN